MTKLNPACSRLIYSTYLGGSGDDFGNGRIAVDGDGNAYVMGSTTSSDFPTTAGAFQPANAGEFDAFIAKIGVDEDEEEEEDDDDDEDDESDDDD